MGKCFVIQPFDRNKFDKRFDDHFAPAIREAGMEPYRVDRDLSVVVPIDAIQQQIRDADACLADITTNNPNVWFELGYALASGKVVVMVCARDREGNFPFDVQHIAIVRYNSGSGSDFQKLEQDITATLKARLGNQKAIESIASASPLTEVEGLSTHETVALAVLMSELPTPEGQIYPQEFKDAMARAGFNAAASNLSIVSLVRRGLIILKDYEGRYEDEPVKVLTLAPAGIDWLLQNLNRLNLTFDTGRDSTVPVYVYDDADPFADE